MEIFLKRTEITYHQDEDSGGRADHYDQFLEVATLDAGGGEYVVLQTERWAVDDREDALRMVNRIFDDLEKTVI